MIKGKLAHTHHAPNASRAAASSLQTFIPFTPTPGENTRSESLRVTGTKSNISDSSNSKGEYNNDADSTSKL